MVEKHLPDGADIHGGGNDLRFPHHENELAQSVGAHPDHTFVRAWAHHGMVTLADDKMAKSVGNILDVKQAIERHGRNALRMWLLQSHYSQPIDYSEEILEDKRESYEHLANIYRTISGSTSASELSAQLATELRERFDAAMQDDFNTPEALADTFDATVRAGREISERPESAREFASLKDALEEVLGILGFDLVEESVKEVQSIPIDIGSLIPGSAHSGSPDRWIRVSMPGQNILEKVARRELARQKKDWETADRIRDELNAEGWQVEDRPYGRPSVLSRR
jgi:cysteinyl-tRNA synthetase